MESYCKLLHVISMIRVIRCTKFHFSRLRGSRVITISMLNIWTGGGAIEVVLETPKLVRSLFMTIPMSVPNFIIFPCSVHRAAIDSHWTNIIINIAASSDSRGQARKWPIGRRRAGRAKRQKQNIHGKNR